MTISITVIIIVLTVAISYWALTNRDIFDKLSLMPYRTVHKKEYYRIFTHAFLHADYLHLGVNMFVLYSFGSFVESVFSQIQEQGMIGSAIVSFLTLYIGGIVIATLTTIQKQKDNPYYISIGASGAVSAVVFASIFFAPLQMLSLFFIIPIPAIVFGVLYLVYSSYMSKKSNDNINHDAHFAGAVFGFVFPMLINPKLLAIFLAGLGL